MKNYNDVKSILSDIEPTEAMYKRLDEEDILNIEKLLEEHESWLASRAVFALSRLNTEQSNLILKNLIKDERIDVRVALASSCNKLSANVSDEILSNLIIDKEEGVRKFAYQSVSLKSGIQLKEKLTKVLKNESNIFLKEILNKKILEMQEKGDIV